jgi:hypothetical protein
MTDPYDAPGVEMSKNPPTPSPDLYPELGEISRAWFREWMGRVFWRFATTMMWTPHWYSLADDSERREEFDRAVAYIRRHGVIELWPPGSRKPKEHVYLYDQASCSKLWSMGAPLAETILINRVPTWAPPTVRPPKDRSRKPDPKPPFDPDRPAPPPRAEPPPPRADPPPPPRTPDQLTLDTRPGTPRPCVVCGAEFTASRIDARYCTGSCRTHAHRVRKAEREAQLTSSST